MNQPPTDHSRPALDLNFQRVYDLTGQVALITGGASGIGRAIAELFASRGARLALVDRNPSVRQVSESIGPEHLGLVADITAEQEVRHAVASVAQKLGRIDVLINSAGIAPLAKSEATPIELWNATLDVNLRGTFLCAREAGQRMIAQRYGRIVNLASQAALIALDGHLAYSASKAGVLGMTRVMAKEWGPHGITVNAISPTVVDTPMGAQSTWSGEAGVAMRKLIPTGRFALPEEVAHAALFLVSGCSRMITGENLVIDGGYTAV
jgi:NAD(P)-dependent dehydrogenase (short-subunit alcohol dehydrogenase family)